MFLSCFTLTYERKMFPISIQYLHVYIRIYSNSGLGINGPILPIFPTTVVVYDRLDNVFQTTHFCVTTWKAPFGLLVNSGFPHGLENLEKWKNFFQSGSFGQNTGKVREI